MKLKSDEPAGDRKPVCGVRRVGAALEGEVGSVVGVVARREGKIVKERETFTLMLF